MIFKKKKLNFLPSKKAIKTLFNKMLKKLTTCGKKLKNINNNKSIKIKKSMNDLNIIYKIINYIYNYL